MSTNTESTLQPDTISKLQKLIRANIDSYDGFVESAKQVKDKNIADLFASIAKERSHLATQLQEYVKWNGAEAEDDGSVAASVHRTWLSVRSKLSGGDAVAVLSEAERGEDYIKEAYEEVIKETAGSPLNDVLLDQYKIVKSGHDRVRDLRDAEKAS